MRESMSKRLTIKELDAKAKDFAAELEEAEKEPGSYGYKSALFAGQRNFERLRDTCPTP
jgi:hypothetical protein